MSTFLNNLNGILWGTPTLILLFAAGLIFSIKTQFFQLRKLGYILKNTLGKVFKKEENTCLLYTSDAADEEFAV